MFKPKCTVYRDWSGPECGEPALSRNDYGGFQCKFHSSLKRNKDKPIGPVRTINGDSWISALHLRIAYAWRMIIHRR